MHTASDLMVLLREFISKDSLDTAYPLLENAALADLVHAWSMIHVNWNIPDYFDELSERIPDNELQRWGYVWSFCDYNVSDLEFASGLTPNEVSHHFNRAKMLRLIYPNGLISPSARQVLALRVSEEIGKGIEAASRMRNNRKG